MLQRTLLGKPVCRLRWPTDRSAPTRLRLAHASYGSEIPVFVRLLSYYIAQTLRGHVWGGGKICH